jgi:hypothetical protein
MIERIKKFLNKIDQTAECYTQQFIDIIENEDTKNK